MASRKKPTSGTSLTEVWALKSRGGSNSSQASQGDSNGDWLNGRFGKLFNKRVL